MKCLGGFVTLTPLDILTKIFKERNFFWTLLALNNQSEMWKLPKLIIKYAMHVISKAERKNKNRKTCI